MEERRNSENSRNASPQLPEWALIRGAKYYRAQSSIIKGNSASTELSSRSVVLYDEFFKMSSVKEVLAHEAAHFLFQQLSPFELTEFSDLSGWSIQVKERKVFEVPPKALIKPDSALNKEEDFANYLEVYLSKPSKLKKINQKMFDFFSKRYPL